jgi:hypothetical protein
VGSKPDLDPHDPYQTVDRTETFYAASKKKTKKQKAVPARLRPYAEFMRTFKRPGKKAEVLRWWSGRK